EALLQRRRDRVLEFVELRALEGLRTERYDRSYGGLLPFVDRVSLPETERCDPGHVSYRIEHGQERGRIRTRGARFRREPQLPAQACRLTGRGREVQGHPHRTIDRVGLVPPRGDDLELLRRVVDEAGPGTRGLHDPAAVLDEDRKDVLGSCRDGERRGEGLEALGRVARVSLRFEEPGPLERERGLFGEGLRQPSFLTAESVLRLEHQTYRSEGLLIDAQRDGQDGTRTRPRGVQFTWEA